MADVRLAMDGAFETQTSPQSEQKAIPKPRVWQRPVPLVALALLVAGIAGLAGWALRPSEQREVSRLAYDLPAGHQLQGITRAVFAVSPDGRRFVYNTTAGLYLRSMDTLEARLLPGTAEIIWDPSFSPDGQSLAYVTRPDGLKRLALSGGAPVVIAEGVGVSWGLSWGVDDTILVGQRQGIMRVSVAGGTPDLVIPAGAGETLDGPQLLPDGDSVLLSVGSGALGDAAGWNDADIVVQSLTSGERTVLIEGGSDARYVSSGHLVYALDDGLFAVPFDVDTLIVSGAPVSVVEGVYRATGTASANYSVTDDGTLFYLAGTAESDQPLAWVDRTGSSEAIETIPPNVYSTPRLAPDGRRVLVVADGDARVYDLASGRENRLTTDGLTGAYAGWSPSGTEVAYSSARGSEGRLNIWIQAADGSGPPRSDIQCDLVCLDRSLRGEKSSVSGTPSHSVARGADGAAATVNRRVVGSSPRPSLPCPRTRPAAPSGRSRSAIDLWCRSGRLGRLERLRTRPSPYRRCLRRDPRHAPPDYQRLRRRPRAADGGRGSHRRPVGICAAAARQPGPCTGVVVWKAPNVRDDNAVVVLRLKDWESLHGR